MAIGVEESDYALGLLKGLDQAIQKNTVEAPIAESNVIPVMVVEGVHGYLRCGEIPGEYCHGRLYFMSEGISRAKPLASWSVLRSLSAEQAPGAHSNLPNSAVLLIAFFPVIECQPNSEAHKSRRWNEQNEDALTDGSLAVLGGRRGRAEAHGAALAEGGRRPGGKQQNE